MKLSTDTQMQHPASGRSRRPASRRFEMYGVGIALAAALGAPALAGQSTYGHGDGSLSAYARNTTVLYGQAVDIGTHQTSRMTRH